MKKSTLVLNSPKPKRVRRNKKPPQEFESRFLRVIQYADHIGVSERTVREWMYAGVIPYLKVRGHLVLIDPLKADAALARLERNEVKAL
jgi:excisionase family DNA binding protein